MKSDKTNRSEGDARNARVEAFGAYLSSPGAGDDQALVELGWNPPSSSDEGGRSELKPPLLGTKLTASSPLFSIISLPEFYSFVKV